MVQLSKAERDLIDDLLECIAEAMSTVDSVDSTYANKTKLQKLLYLAIDEFDLPITYSWYLAGAVLPDDPATPETLESAFDRVESPATPSISTAESVAPVSGDEDSSENDSSSVEDDDVIEPILNSIASSIDTDSPADPSETSTINGHPRETIVDFYVAELPDVWHQNTMRFLQNFYLDHAPTEFRDLYVQSTHLRIRLKDIEEAIEAHLEDEQPATSIQEHVKAVGLDISDLHMTIRDSDLLQSTFKNFAEGTDIIEDGLMMLSQLSPDRLTTDHLEAVESIQAFYYYYVWRLPCLIISRETAAGPSAEMVREERDGRLTDFEALLQDKIDELEAELTEVGLRPTYGDYPVEDDDVGDTIGELADQYLK